MQSNIVDLESVGTLKFGWNNDRTAMSHTYAWRPLACQPILQQTAFTNVDNKYKFSGRGFWHFLRIDGHGGAEIAAATLCGTGKCPTCECPKSEPDGTETQYPFWKVRLRKQVEAGRARLLTGTVKQGKKREVRRMVYIMLYVTLNDMCHLI
jgi:hypothetical protein